MTGSVAEGEVCVEPLIVSGELALSSGSIERRVRLVEGLDGDSEDCRLLEGFGNEGLGEGIWMAGTDTSGLTKLASIRNLI